MPLVKIVGLDHVVVRCADVERSLEFYCDTLGLEPERVDDWRRGEVLFPSVRITPTTIIDLFGFAERDGINVDHICVVIEPVDLDELAKHFPDAQRGDGLYGAQGYASSLYVRDPDGNTVELRSYEDRS
jgi:catechol 2,3-dioxygenase-like lactoylglutathione lyase family enzyme